MNRYDRLMQRILAGEKILIDGATGHELFARGVPRADYGWSGGAALTHPDVLRAIHEDYIDLGASVVIANTFATSRHICRDAGIEDQFEFLNRRSVELAVEARDGKAAELALEQEQEQEQQAEQVLVAGGISHWSFSGEHPSLTELRRNMEDEAAIMADAGADLLMLEMMVDIERLLIVLQSALKTGLPVWPGFSVKADKHGNTILWDGPLFVDALDAIADSNVPLISIMHSNVEFVEPAISVLQSKWGGPIGVYADAGKGDKITPAEYAGLAEGWLDQGVSVIGTCCGFGVDYIKALQPVVTAANQKA